MSRINRVQRLGRLWCSIKSISSLSSVKFFFFSLVEKSATFDILPPELLGKLPVPDGSIKVFLTGSVAETDQRFAIQDVVEFTKPELEVTVRCLYMATSLVFEPTAMTSTQSGLLELIAVTPAVPK